MANGRAKLAIGQGLSVWVLEAPDGFGEAGFHSHHAIQLTVCLEGELMLASPDRAVRARALAVPTDIPHRLEAHGLFVFLFVEPESAAGRALSQALFGSGEIVPLERPDLLGLASLVSALDGDLSGEAMLAAGQAWLDALCPPAAFPPLPDPRVRKIIAFAAGHPELSLNQAATACGVHLSPSRLRHLFVEQTGLAFKTYLLWLRMTAALRVYSEGKSLTEAAHAAGFSDSAHFSRIFRRSFGLPATTLERV